MAPLPYKEIALELSFGQIERVLAATENIRHDRRSAFANRLKNYQKASFPEGINTGRGRAARYGIGHVLQLGLALELNQLGLTPERAAAVINSDMHSVAMTFSAAASETRHSLRRPWFLYLDPAGLSDLMEEGDEDRSVGSFFYAGFGQFKESFDSWGRSGKLRRLSILNVTDLLHDVATATAREARLPVAQIYDAAKEWASPYIHNEPNNGSDSKA
jgi:hypothetical protein